MLSSLLFLAEATGHAVEAAHGEAAGGITKIFSDFGIDTPLFLAQAVSFTVVAILLWKLGFKPVLATIEERQKQIADGLSYAEKMKAELAATQQKNDAALKEAQVKAQQIIAETQKAAKEFADKQQKEAVEKANALLTKAHEAIELEKKKMLAEARTEIARLVVATTQRVLAKELTDADRSRYNESAARELANV